jgi:hypothetical protein
MPVGDDALLRVEKDVNGDCLLTTVGLRHGGDADEFTDLNVGQRCLDESQHPRRIDELHFHHLATAGFDVEDVPLHLFDLAADAHSRRRLLGKARGCGEQQGKAGHAEQAPCHLIHVVLPKNFSAAIIARCNNNPPPAPIPAGTLIFP